jgi:hypothetical protein
MALLRRIASGSLKWHAHIRQRAKESLPEVILINGTTMNSLRKSSMESCGTFNCLLKSSMALRWLLAPLPSSLPLVLQLPLAGREEPPGSPQQVSGPNEALEHLRCSPARDACLGCVLVTSRCAAGADGAACGTQSCSAA